MPQISKATEYNWKKLNSNSEEKLTKRANKTLSAKRVVASSYLNDSRADALLSIVSSLDKPIESIMYSLVVSFLEYARISEKQHVKSFLLKYSDWGNLVINVPEGTWEIDEDLLGFIYQSLITEGERNLTGQYYTGRKIVEFILDSKELTETETFLDPCCGSGAFLLGVKTSNPANLYGFDINPVAVMIATANLLVKYSDREFVPNIYCLDFLRNDVFDEAEKLHLPANFDNIYTNPPWGSDKKGEYVKDYPQIKSKERASMVIVKSLATLSASGTLYFLLPTSLLKIKTHSDIRRLLLVNTAIQRIDLYNNRFDGVFTDYFSIKVLPKKTDCQHYKVTSDKGISEIMLPETERKKGNIVIENLSELDNDIIRKMEACKHDDLTHSQWALGIVTGDNKNKVKSIRLEGMEPVFTGKQISPFNLLDETSYIHFIPDNFQQCAKEEFFRAPEKLIYRFIAKYPIVAYDNKQCLCLNSANILIPELDGITIKSTAALLNSTLYRYYYSVKFRDIKVLKGNLQELPFPKLSTEQNDELGRLVDFIQSQGYSDDFQRQLDSLVYAIFGITPDEQAEIIK